MGDVIATNSHEGIKLEEYKGAYSLSAQRDNNGKYWPIWAKYRKGRDEYQEKDWPVKVTLGDRATAIGALKMIMAEIEGKQADGLPDEEPPF